MYGFSQPKSGAPDKYQESSLNEKLQTGQWLLSPQNDHTIQVTGLDRYDSCQFTLT